ncbi:MAG: multidrug efflux SMR transporter [Nocardia sp.]|nr:multidrug efflux SMR transporter [Nocardia sp.]
MAWFLLAAAILSEVAATLSLKGSETVPALYLVVAVGYVAAFVFLARVLAQGMALGVAYGIWGASGVALTATLSTFIFGEAFTPTMGVGLVLVIAGVVLVETGSPHASEATSEKDR